MIVYLRVVPGFWIAVEELRRPELRARPLIMGGLPHQRGTVREVNFLAQQCGVHPGMPLSQAHQHCPDGIFLVPELSRYEPIWKVLCDVLRTYTPLVEPVEVGQVVCDLTGCERQWGDEWSAARAIASHVRWATGLAPWFGVASNRLVAQLASTTVGADGIVVVDAGKERLFLADLPITALPDVDPRLALTFRVLGLQTIGQLAALPASAVKQRFGIVGARLHGYARGVDSRPVLPPPVKPSVTACYECEDGSIEEAVAAIHRLSDSCARELEDRQLAGRLVKLTLMLSPSSPTPPPPTGEEREAVAALPVQVLPLSHKRESGFPIPYRIHSMLPQPGSAARAISTAEPQISHTADSGRCDPGGDGSVSKPASVGPDPSVGGSADPGPTEDGPVALSVPSSLGGRNTGDPLSAVPGHGIHTSSASVAVRTAIATAPPLLEQAQRLLLQSWPGVDRDAGQQLLSIELSVAEFEVPIQSSFLEFNRLDQTGRLGGMSAERLQSLSQQAQVLAARHGEVPFRHVTHMDPNQILAERRFRWRSGLPWDAIPDRAIKRGRKRL